MKIQAAPLQQRNLKPKGNVAPSGGEEIVPSSIPDDSVTFSSKDKKTSTVMGAVVGALAAGASAIPADAGLSIPGLGLIFPGLVAGWFGGCELGEKLAESIFESRSAQHNWGIVFGLGAAGVGAAGVGAAAGGLGYAMSLLPTPLRVATFGMLGAMAGAKVGEKMSS